MQISIVILLVLLCRLLVGKVSKQACYFLWVIVAVRLLVPAMSEASFSIFNATRYLETLVTTKGMSGEADFDNRIDTESSCVRRI